MLVRRGNGHGRRGHHLTAAVDPAVRDMNRRAFLRRSGLAAGSLSIAGALPLTSVLRAQAVDETTSRTAEIRKNNCTHCSVGCTVLAVVENGVWVGQEPAWDSPINRGTHCAKGAAIRE